MSLGEGAWQALVACPVFGPATGFHPKKQIPTTRDCQTVGELAAMHVTTTLEILVRIMS